MLMMLLIIASYYIVVGGWFRIRFSIECHSTKCSVESVVITQYNIAGSVHRIYEGLGFFLLVVAHVVSI